MPRRRYNNQFGTITDNPLTSGATTFNSATLAAFPAIVAPDYAAIVLDPDSASEEIVWITAHTASATSATILRHQEGSSAVAHTSGAIWKHGPTAVDFPFAPCVYAPPGWDDVWVKGKISGRPNILLIGASDATGYLSTDCTTLAFPELLRTRLAAQYGVWGDFYHARMNVVDAPSFTGTPPFVNGGAGTTQQFQGYGSLDTWAATGSTLLTFNTPYACTQVDIIYLDSVGASPPQYAVDGGSLVAFPALTGTGKQLRLSITGLAATTHSIALRQQTASSLRVMGCACYPTGSAASSGLGWARMNYPGSAAMFYLFQGGYPSIFPGGYDQVDYLTDCTSVPGVRPITTGFGFPTGGTPAAVDITGKIHLVYIVADLMGNDCNQALAGPNPTDPEGSHEAMRRICSAVRRASDDVSIALVIPSLPDGMYSDLLTANTISYAWSWENYKSKAWDLGREFNALVIDSDADFGSLGVANGYQTQTVGGFHLTNTGHARTDALVYPMIV